MAQDTKIEWCDATWTIVQGCDYDSPGCINCYAPRIVHRLSRHPNPKVSAPIQGLVEKAANGKLVWTGRVACRTDRLDWPLGWKKPLKIFLPSHGDLFHEDVPSDFIDMVYRMMENCHWHTFQQLTKRSARQKEFVRRRYKGHPGPAHIWHGVSIEDKKRLSRLADLKDTPSPIRFISFEPLLEDLGEIDLTGIHQAITGGEGGPGRRPHDPDWQRSILRQCRAQGVAFFGKQWDKVRPLPADLLVREFPA